MYSLKQALLPLSLGLMFAQTGFAVELAKFTNQDGMVACSDENVMKGPFAAGWEDGNLRKGFRDYVVCIDAANKVVLKGRYLPDTRGTTFIKKVTWDVSSNPIIQWRWRVQKWPPGAKTDDDSKRDAAASVYVTLKDGYKGLVIKYIWSEQEKVGTQYKRGRWNPMGSLVGEVVRTGGKTGEWVTERRNVIEDFERLYKRKYTGLSGGGIGVMSDGDQTKSQPEADYADFEALPALK
jgi:hypothetical protein